MNHKTNAKQKQCHACALSHFYLFHILCTYAQLLGNKHHPLYFFAAEKATYAPHPLYAVLNSMEIN